MSTWAVSITDDSGTSKRKKTKYELISGIFLLCIGVDITLLTIMICCYADPTIISFISSK
eukprot:Awhi_evm1s11351